MRTAVLIFIATITWNCYINGQLGAAEGTEKKNNGDVLLDEAQARIAKEELEAAKRGLILSDMKVNIRRLDHGNKPPEYKFKDLASKNITIRKLEIVFEDAKEKVHPRTPQLHTWKLKSGTKGNIDWGVLIYHVINNREVIVQVIIDGTDYYLIRDPEVKDRTMILLRNYDTKDMADGKSFNLEGYFHVIGTEKVKGETMFVMEPAEKK